MRKSGKTSKSIEPRQPASQEHYLSIIDDYCAFIRVVTNPHSDGTVVCGSKLVSMALDMVTYYRDMVLKEFMDPKNDNLTCAELLARCDFGTSAKVREHVQMVIDHIEKTGGKTRECASQLGKLKHAIELMQPNLDK